MGAALRIQPRRKTAENVYLPAPLGGINAFDPISQMSPKDAIYLYNLIASEYGLRSRLGYQEWVTGLTGGASGEVRSLLPFAGSHKNGSSDKQFAVTGSGIWDVSASTASPTKLVSFVTQTPDVGYGIAHTFATPGGRFLPYCDETNGLYLYTESTGLWTQVASGIAAPWITNTAVLVGNQVVNAGNAYQCITAGTTAGSGGPTTTAADITDGSAHWKYLSAQQTNVIGPSLADQQLGFTALPGNFVFVTAFKSRLWFVERDTSRAWYLSTNSIYGVATSFDFGSKMRAGGPLVGLYNWSYDGGAGMDTLLVGISGAGDIVIYQGTDPSQASTFGLKGAWFCGGVPSGRRIAIEYGGEVLILSLLGVLPLSRLVTGSSIFDRGQYTTVKIHNLFNLLAQTYKSLPGWSIQVHPQDNALLVVVPQPVGYPYLQLAMSFSTKGWSQYRGLPILSAGIWEGSFYFGTPDGRVCINQGYVDAVTLADPNAFTPVAWSLLHSFQNGGNMRKKAVRMAKVDVLSGVQTPGIQAVAKFDFDTIEPADTSSAELGSGAGDWDTGKWDEALWGGDYTPSESLLGTSGIGRAVSLAVRGQAITRTIYAGAAVIFEQGGEL